MSIVHYISSNKELPLGEFGVIRTNNNISNEVSANCNINSKISSNHIPIEKIIGLPEIKDTEIDKYENYDDLAGIYVSRVDNTDNGIRRQFKNYYIYCVSPCCGKFIISDIMKKTDSLMYNINMKCINELFKYIYQNIPENGMFEIYTCYIGEEGVERNHELNTIIDLDSLVISDNFAFLDKQYILITKEKWKFQW